MVTITCPWCAEDGSVELVRIPEPQATFTCSDCGTTLAFVEEATIAELELAA
jgi:uncharacterized Zn finger protein